MTPFQPPNRVAELIEQISNCDLFEDLAHFEKNTVLTELRQLTVQQLTTLLEQQPRLQFIVEQLRGMSWHSIHELFQMSKNIL